MSADPLTDIMATVDTWIAGQGRPERCTPQTAMKVVNLTIMHGIEHLPAYLAHIGPAKNGNAWGWLFGCLQSSYEQFAQDRQADLDRRARVTAEAARALDEAKASACQKCGGRGYTGPQLEDDIKSIRSGLERETIRLCACSGGRMWRNLLEAPEFGGRRWDG